LLILPRSIVMAMPLLLATPAAAELRLPCLWSPFGGCSVTFVSPEYAARPVQPLNPEKALAEVNAFRAENGLKPLVLDARLSRAAAMQSEAQAERSWIGQGSRAARRLSCEDRFGECRRGAQIFQRRIRLLEAEFGTSHQFAAH
jgi:cysteine-rich secretory family protein